MTASQETVAVLIEERRSAAAKRLAEWEAHDAGSDAWMKRHDALDEEIRALDAEIDKRRGFIR